MNSWYTVKVKFIKEFQDGTLKRVSEPYLVNALSFTDAEARIYQEVGEYVRGEFIVSTISKTDLADIFQYDDAQKWFKVKVAYVSEDADSGKEKKINTNFLVSANNLKEAYDRVEENLKGLMVSYEIPSIILTPIIEIYPYIPSEEVETTTNKNKSKIVEEEEDLDDEEESNTSSVNVAYVAPEDDEEEEFEEEIEDEEELE